ncbi:hypothetical protein CEXT_546021 [Caerostris extrusa]|uniref:Uncharacterized protein n=1 Tax=Caerostris extrusa TaxID=172846 RepID=A0AAV4MYG4_CAEEX|nr:hypothetical protein CEXT_546021 [Caerostris extrusa]
MAQKEAPEERKEKKKKTESHTNDPTSPSLKVPPLSGPGITGQLQQHSFQLHYVPPHNFPSPDIGPPNLEVCVLPAQLRDTR